MSDSAQKRAVDRYRQRLSENGLSRFEVIGRESDRELVRKAARLLAEDSEKASALRASITATVAEGRRPSIVEALRRSPLAGENLVFERPKETGREIDL